MSQTPQEPGTPQESESPKTYIDSSPIISEIPVCKPSIRTFTHSDPLAGDNSYRINDNRIRNYIDIYEYNTYPFYNPPDLKWMSCSDIEYPSFCDKICYYVKSIYNNDDNRIQYLDFKSKMYTLVNRTSFLFSMLQELQYFDDEASYFKLDEEIINIFKKADQYIKKNSKLLTLSQSPFKLFIKDYFNKRDTLLQLDDTLSDNFTNNRYNIALNTTYTINRLEILLESVKTSVDNNDQLLFKLLVLIMNSLIILAEYAWKYYWIDGDSYGNN